MWLVNALRPRTLPVAVTLKRFLAPECVFILGIGGADDYGMAPAQPPGICDDPPRGRASRGTRRCPRRAAALRHLVGRARRRAAVGHDGDQRPRLVPARSARGRTLGLTAHA